MTGQDAIRFFHWTRSRTIKILQSLSPETLDYKLPSKRPRKDSPGKIRKILKHIIQAEVGWIHRLIMKEKKTEEYDISTMNIDEIIALLERTRAKTVEWLEENKDNSLEFPYGKKASTQISWIMYHVAEHEAYHLGQIALIAEMNGQQIPWI